MIAFIIKVSSNGIQSLSYHQDSHNNFCPRLDNIPPRYPYDHIDHIPGIDRNLGFVDRSNNSSTQVPLRHQFCLQLFH